MDLLAVMRNELRRWLNFLKGVNLALSPATLEVATFPEFSSEIKKGEKAENGSDYLSSRSECNACGEVNNYRRASTNQRSKAGVKMKKKTVKISLVQCYGHVYIFLSASVEWSSLLFLICLSFIHSGVRL